MEKKKIKEFEIVEKLKKLWEENERKIKMRFLSETFPFLFSLPLPEIPPSFLERISNKFLKEFDWKKFEKRDFLESDLGLFLTVFLKKNVENYIFSQKRKRIKEENIKPIEVHLKVKEVPITLDYLGYQNRKLHLVIEGDCGGRIGEEMQNGKITVRGNCKDEVGSGMQGGKLIIEGNCGGGVGEGMQDGEIIVRGNCKDAPGVFMRGGKITIEKDCEGWIEVVMWGGELNIKGEAKSFYECAFSPTSRGIIIRKGVEIWRDGNWTKEGIEMRERGEIIVKQKN